MANETLAKMTVIMAKRCLICGNLNGVDEVSTHRFPANVELRRQWVMFVQNNGVDAQQIFASSKLCSRHFVPGHDFGGIAYRRRLTDGAVPSVVSITYFDYCIEKKSVNPVPTAFIPMYLL
ncbi:hypothetical protein ACI65C_013621 [Semiaphis heraclei]